MPANPSNFSNVPLGFSHEGSIAHLLIFSKFFRTEEYRWYASHSLS
jgi:hypothetical protein